MYSCVRVCVCRPEFAGNGNCAAISVFLLGDSSSFVSVGGTVGSGRVMWDKTAMDRALTVAPRGAWGSESADDVTVSWPTKGEVSLRCCHVNMIFEGVACASYTKGTLF